MPVPNQVVQQVMQSKFLGSNLDGIDLGMFVGADGGLKNVIDYTLYDTVRVIAGTAWTPGEQTMFSQPINGAGALANTGAAYVKTELDTNMINGSQLPEGYYFVAHSIQVQLTLPESLDATPLGSGATISPTSVGAPSSGANLLAALAQGCTIRFRVDNRDLEQGPLWNFPTDFGQSGYTASTGTNATPAQTGAQNNGLGAGRTLSYFRHIKPLQRFNIFLKNVVTFSTIPMGAQIRVALVGWLWLPVG